MITVFINGVICPTVNDDSILVTRSITDIENPEQKQIDYTKGFLIQNTAAVATLFSQIFEVNQDIQNVTTTNFTPDFNPNLKASIVVMNDNAIVLKGYCQMIDIIITDDNNVNYSINAYGSIGNFFNDIKNLTLNELDFSDYNHDWTYTNVTDSWNPTLGEGYVYPMIDYGLTTNYNVWSITSFRPAIFAKDILDRIFAAVGWSYSSNFLTSTRFKSLIIPFSAENLFIDNDEIYDRSFLVKRDSTVLTQTLTSFYNYAAASPIIFNDDTGVLGSYPLHNTSGNDYDLGTGKWTCAATGDYQFGASLSLRQINNTGKYAPRGTVQLLLLKDVGGVITKIEGYTFTFAYQAATFTSDTAVFSKTTAVVHAESGEDYYWAIGLASISPSVGTVIYSSGADIDISIDIDSGWSLIPQSNLVYGDEIDMNALLPNDHLQKDFVLGLFKMFNLYVEQTDEKTLLIEPREDYYTSEIEDWTDLMDIGNEENPPKFIPMGMSQNKRYKFTYTDDTDILNDRYLKSYQEVYGTKLVDINTDFLTETKEIRPLFAATPLSNALSGTNNRIISDIRFGDEKAVKLGQSKLRILYWGGLISCSQYTIKNTPTGADVGYWTSYPYAGHLDNPYSPTFDLNFAPPEAVYYDYNIGATGNVTYTDSNLYTQYWYRNIMEFTNKNSKILEAMFDISLYRYMTLSFRRQYFIKEAYYRLIEVEDYNLSGTELVKCKLLKVDREAPYTTSSKRLRGGNGTFENGGNIPTKGIPLGKDGRIERLDRAYEGSGGYNTGNDTVNKGTGNNIPNSAEQSYIFGSDGNTLLNERTFVFNSDDKTVLHSGAMFNGVYLEYKFELEFDETFLQEIDGGTITPLLPILADNEHYEITKLYLSIGAGTTNYSFTGSGNLIIKTSDGTTVGTIHGSDWLGEGDGVILGGTKVTNVDFGNSLTIEAIGTYSAGDRDLKLVVFYQIISI